MNRTILQLKLSKESLYEWIWKIKGYGFRLNILWKRDVEEGSRWNGEGHLLQRCVTVGLASKGLGYKEKLVELRLYLTFFICW
ncbi:hypothetical protein P8452_33089 [Trifolium repens]|nr:hypothetical protein P8452_33089 [Trifolium repens]